ncbi:hypothetical protein FRC06_011575, partial [Ceratobasidium sp. 370]
MEKSDTTDMNEHNGEATYRLRAEIGETESSTNIRDYATPQQLVEPAAYKLNPTEPGPPQRVENSTSRSLKSKPKRSSKEVLQKGGWTSTIPGTQPEIRADSPYEGTLVLVQTNGCLRKVWTEVFQNKPISPISTSEVLKRLLENEWGWWPTYGHELAQVVCALKTPFTPAPHKPRKSKRKAAELDPEPHSHSPAHIRVRAQGLADSMANSAGHSQPAEARLLPAIHHTLTSSQTVKQ